jgi:hypothetical protein
MSICIDYFFNHEDDLSGIARKINLWAGCFLAPYEGTRHDLFCRFLGMELSLSNDQFENDQDLNFEDYRYHLGIRTPIPDADLRMAQVPAMMLLAYALFYRVSLKGMLVYDMQHVLARYEERLDLKGGGAEEMFDVVSNKFVVLPGHLVDLEKHLRERLILSEREA